MVNIPESNSSSISTTWAWKKVKMRGLPHPEGTAAPQGRPFSRFGRRSRRERTWIQVQYRGGPESSWLICRGTSCRRFPGHLCLEDVLVVVLGEVSSYDAR
jgi:hypothetical protein